MPKKAELEVGLMNYRQLHMALRRRISLLDPRLTNPPPYRVRILLWDEARRLEMEIWNRGIQMVLPLGKGEEVA